METEFACGATGHLSLGIWWWCIVNGRLSESSEAHTRYYVDPNAGR